MSETDNTAAQDLASLKLPELRKMAAERGLRGVSAPVSYTHLTLPTIYSV